MSYCTPSDVGILLQLTYSATTQPTTTQVQSICDQVSAEIDLKLKQIGVASVTDSTLLSYLKLVCSQGVACFVGSTYFNNIQNTSGTISNFYCTNYKQKLDEIVNNPDMFTSAGGTIAFSSNVTEGTTDEDDIPSIDVDWKY